MYILRPRKSLQGVALKRWYKRVNRVVKGAGFIPMGWKMYQGIYVRPDQLHAVMTALYI